ncbi:MAG: hypothetical protein KME21_23245 [Desmonostoc vinosum HA7617-LM4]|jgi:hypothetical protein|nr:hypothetical protein [Desmonostoc vinosum HA7617-LM4]
MKLLSNSHSQAHFPQNLIIIGTFLSLISLFGQPLNVQALATNYQISQNTTQSKTIPANRLVIGGINLSMSEQQVRKILGKPLSIKNGYEEIAGKTRTLQYRGLTVKLLEDVKPTNKFFVYEIEANSSKYITIDGVKVGDSVAKVIKIYGNPQSTDTNIFNYEVDSTSPIYFNFTIDNGKVKKILFGDFLG